jgi:CheY-like chemotaxis protein
LQQDNGIRVEVEDTGIGVPEERRERLFLPFSQADGSTTRKYGGTGLGLAISRQLVELMGGEIGCEPGRDRGSLFYFQLPLEARSSARNWPARKQGDCLLVMKAGERRDSYQDLLCAMGFQVSVAGSISQTLEAAANHWKVILTDQHLPDGNAVELQQALDRLKVRTPESLVRLVPWRERPVERLNDEWFRATLPEPCRLHQLIEAMGVEPEGDALLPQLEQLNQALDERVQTTDLYPTVPRVLIAEDNAINQRVAARMLEHLGVEPVVVENGAQALEALGLERFAMVFMDCQMPEMDGFAATEAWRSKERLADWERVPIIAMTAHAMQGDRERCLAAGMDDYMTKPISRTGLEGMLSKWLWRGKAAHPSGDLISASAQRA